jgi:hypothetical protein
MELDDRSLHRIGTFYGSQKRSAQVFYTRVDGEHLAPWRSRTGLRVRGVIDTVAGDRPIRCMG